MTKNTLSLLSFLLLGGTMVLGGCATVPTDPEEKAVYDEANDPIEPFNRGVFAFNQVLDRYLIKPVAQGYDYLLPDYAQDRVHTFLNNLGEPVNFFNNVLQGRGSDAMDTSGRFLMNSTVGVLGLFDVAKDMGVPERRGDFGQTLYTYGVDSGPYLVLPLIGPSNPRDAVGLAGDIVMDPWQYVLDSQFDDSTTNWIVYGRMGTQVIDSRSRTIELTDSLEKSSLDYYATMRSISRQYRDKQLSGQSTEVPGGSSFSPSGN